MAFPLAGGKGRPSPMRRSSLSAGMIAAVLGFVLFSGSAAAATYSAPGFSETVVASGLSSPTAFAWTPDGRMLVLEKAGRIRLVTGTGLQTAAALDISARVDSGSEKGLLGIVLHPSFASNGWIYLYYTSLTPKNRIGRFTMTGNVIDPASEVVILDGIDATNGNHNGGTVAIGPDGKLYAAPGDSGTGGAKSQILSPGSFNGKVLRMELDGTPAAGNPFLGDVSKEPRIFAYGFRNPFRWTFRPSNGALFVNDVGQSTREEIDVVTAGGNYGWPMAEGFLGSCTGCIPPVFDYDRSVGGATIGGTFITGTVYPAFLQGMYLFADYVSNWIRYLAFDGTNAVVGTLQGFASNVEGADFLAQGPDGYVYYSAINVGRIYRINPPGIAFYSVPPCRLVDTRGAAGSYGGPALPAGGERAFVAAGQCGIPADARSVSMNVTVTAPASGGFLAVYPDGTALPPTSTVNFGAGQTRAGNTVVALNPSGAIRVHCQIGSGTAQLVLDVDGYFR